MQIGEIAKAQKIPTRFLEQILLILKRSGLVASSRGKLGGYTLAKKPSEISLAAVIGALEGPVQFTTKKLKSFPVIFEALREVEAHLEEELGKITLEDLLVRKLRQDRTITYNI